MRLARWHFESRRASWWRQLRGLLWLVWHQGSGAAWFYDRWVPIGDDSVRPLHLSARDIEYLELRTFARGVVMRSFQAGRPKE